MYKNQYSILRLEIVVGIKWMRIRNPDSIILDYFAQESHQALV